MVLITHHCVTVIDKPISTRALLDLRWWVSLGSQRSRCWPKPQGSEGWLRAGVHVHGTPSLPGKSAWEGQCQDTVITEAHSSCRSTSLDHKLPGTPEGSPSRGCAA
jgi:hypothetical protein